MSTQTFAPPPGQQPQGQQQQQPQGQSMPSGVGFWSNRTPQDAQALHMSQDDPTVKGLMSGDQNAAGNVTQQLMQYYGANTPSGQTLRYHTSTPLDQRTQYGDSAEGDKAMLAKLYMQMQQGVNPATSGTTGSSISYDVNNNKWDTAKELGTGIKMLMSAPAIIGSAGIAAPMISGALGGGILGGMGAGAATGALQGGLTGGWKGAGLGALTGGAGGAVGGLIPGKGLIPSMMRGAASGAVTSGIRGQNPFMGGMYGGASGAFSHYLPQGGGWADNMGRRMAGNMFNSGIRGQAPGIHSFF